MNQPNQGCVHREQAGPGEAGCRLLDHLASRHPQVPEATWRQRLAAGEVSLDGAPATGDERLRPGQRIAWTRPPWVEPEAPLAMALLYEDAHLAAVAKPAGLPTLPGGGQFQDHTLLVLLRRRWPEATPMHRLGRGTSGLVLVAPTAGARAPLRRAFEAGSTRKVYRTLCAGDPVWESLAIDAPIGPVPHGPTGTLHAAAPEGRPAWSRATVLERRGGCALLEVEIRTGRPHQIRIHLAWAGHPLVGDPLYGPGGIPLPGSTALPSDLGYRLHAHRLELDHPATGQRLVLTCAPPPDLRIQSAEEQASPGEPRGPRRR